MMYLTIIYMFVIAVLVSAIGGYIIYKASYKTITKPLSYILGGITTLLISFPLTKILMFGGVWFFHLPVTLLAIVLYIAFLLYSNGNIKLIKWIGVIALILVIFAHIYLITLTIFLK